MGIDLHWEDENGHSIAEFGDPRGLVKRILPDPASIEFICLRFVDPYGDTLFNQLQIPQVVAELEKLIGQPHTPEIQQHLQAMLEFAKQPHGVHTYLKFYGD
jgi:hypothetical protein